MDAPSVTFGDRQSCQLRKASRFHDSTRPIAVWHSAEVADSEANALPMPELDALDPSIFGAAFRRKH